jgi:hypothetical protein
MSNEMRSGRANAEALMQQILVDAARSESPEDHWMVLGFLSGVMAAKVRRLAEVLRSTGKRNEK